MSHTQIFVFALPSLMSELLPFDQIALPYSVFEILTFDEIFTDLVGTIRR